MSSERKLKPRRKEDPSLVFLCKILALELDELINLFLKALKYGESMHGDFLIEFLGVFDGKCFFRVRNVKERRVVWQSWMFKWVRSGLEGLS